MVLCQLATARWAVRPSSFGIPTDRTSFSAARRSVRRLWGLGGSVLCR